jgi:hypothetical protein
MQSVMRESELHIDAETNARCNIAYMSKCGQAKDNNSNDGNVSKDSPAMSALKRGSRKTEEDITSASLLRLERSLVYCTSDWLSQNGLPHRCGQ